MARINRKLAIGGATVITLAGVSVAMAFIGMYQVSGRTDFTPVAGNEPTKANVVLGVSDLNVIRAALTAGPEGVQVPVSALTDIPTKIVASDLLPDLIVPPGCPDGFGGGFRLSQPTFSTGFDGRLTSGTAVPVGTFKLTFDNTIGKDQQDCYDSTVPYAAVFGPGGGFVFSPVSATEAALRVDFICTSSGGAPTDYPDTGPFTSGDKVYRLRNNGGVELNYEFNSNLTGTLAPGASAYLPSDRGNPPVRITSPVVKTVSSTAANTTDCTKTDAPFWS